MVARIAAEPISTSTAVSDFRARPLPVDQPASPVAQSDPLPPVPAPVPTPVPAPALVTPTEAFAAALIAERLPTRRPNANEVRLRQGNDWQVPASALRLTDREV